MDEPAFNTIPQITPADLLGIPRLKTRFVVLSYHEHEPVQVYGTFPTAEEAREWATRQSADAYDVHEILDINEE